MSSTLVFASCGAACISRQKFMVHHGEFIVVAHLLMTACHGGICGFLVQVREVFDDMMAAGLQPTLLTWNTLLNSVSANGDWLTALDIVAKVRRCSCLPEHGSCRDSAAPRNSALRSLSHSI